jgi:hypothetical protein
MEEKVVLELTWDEYTTMMSALQAVNNMVDSDKLSKLYIKLSMDRKVIKHRD